jgi:hypothetical protein
MPHESSKPDSQTTSQFLSDLLTKANTFATHADTQANILIGVSSALFVFAVSNAGGNSDHPLLFYILGFFAALSALVALIGVHPPRVVRKKGQPESVMYNLEITSFSSAQEYEKRLNEVLTQDEAIVRQYALEIYNLYKYYYRPKRLLFSVARNLLFIGIILSFVVFLLNV